MSLMLYGLGATLAFTGGVGLLQITCEAFPTISSNAGLALNLSLSIGVLFRRGGRSLLKMSLMLYEVRATLAFTGGVGLLQITCEAFPTISLNAGLAVNISLSIGVIFRRGGRSLLRMSFMFPGRPAAPFTSPNFTTREGRHQGEWGKPQIWSLEETLNTVCSGQLRLEAF